MRVVIAGGHGKIALLLERLLAGRGDQAVGLIRDPAHVADVQPVPAGTISRADVATVIAALLDEPGTRHQTLELTGGDSPVAAAVRSIS